MTASLEETLAALSARLDRQAAAIKDLRVRIKLLEAEQDAASAQTAVTQQVLPVAPPPAVQSPTGQSGTYVPSPLCCMCGEAKEAGRTALTCKACAAERTAIIKEGRDRTAITRTACTSCGAVFKPQTRFLCMSCSKGHKIWAASQ